jgi:SCY1-like protein 1
VAGFVDKFPLQFCKYKILPELLKGLEFSGLSSKALEAALHIGARLEPQEFEKLISPLLVKLFASNDRSIRVSLCENLHLYIDRLSTKDVNDTIFEQVATGFQDTNPIVRERTLKAVTYLATKVISLISFIQRQSTIHYFDILHDCKATRNLASEPYDI